MSVLEPLQAYADNRDEIVISEITYAELRLGSIDKKASPKHERIVAEFIESIDRMCPFDKEAADHTTGIRKPLAKKGTPISNNDSMIAGHALATSCIVVTISHKECSRVPNLIVENRAKSAMG